jgi:hypothetical protein
MSRIEAEIKQLEPLVGGRITAAINTPDNESFGFVVTLPDKTTRHVWVDCDPEGNGPGHLNIENPNERP